MATDSLVAFGLATFILLLISIYAKHHRAEDRCRKKHQEGVAHK